MRSILFLSFRISRTSREIVADGSPSVLEQSRATSETLLDGTRPRERTGASERTLYVFLPAPLDFYKAPLTQTSDNLHFFLLRLTSGPARPPDVGPVYSPTVDGMGHLPRSPADDKDVHPRLDRDRPRLVDRAGVRLLPTLVFPL